MQRLRSSLLARFAVVTTLGCTSSMLVLPTASSFCLRQQQQQQPQQQQLRTMGSSHYLPYTTPMSSTNQLNLSRLFSSLSGPDSAAAVDETVVAGPELPPIALTAKRLFLVRHGEVINPGGDRPVYYGAMDVPLSSLGEEEAKAAAAYLKGLDSEIDLVVSSPLVRAVYGAQQVLDLQSSLAEPDIFVLEGFKELDRGSWCGQTKDEIGAEMMARFDACDESVTPEGGESYPFLKERVLKARDTVLEKLSPGRAAVIVSHLQVTRSVLSEAMDIPTEEMAGLKVATASVSCIDYDAAAGIQTVHFQSFKPDVGLQTSDDGAN